MALQLNAAFANSGPFRQHGDGRAGTGRSDDHWCFFRISAPVHLVRGSALTPMRCILLLGVRRTAPLRSSITACGVRANWRAIVYLHATPEIGQRERIGQAVDLAAEAQSLVRVCRG